MIVVGRAAGGVAGFLVSLVASHLSTEARTRTEEALVRRDELADRTPDQLSRGWYRRFPFLPLPARDYVRWRMHTAYGDYDAVPSAAEIERYARWVGSDR